MKTKLEARPYRIGDCLLFDLQEDQALDLAPEQWTALSLRAPEGPAWTFWRSGEPVAAGGVASLKYGRFEAWALVGKRASPRDRFELFSFARAALANFPARRIEATAREGWAPACASLVRLGFKFEGVMRRAAWDGADLHLYARVR